MYAVSHSKIINFGLLLATRELFQCGYSSMTDAFEKFESMHELLDRYETDAERPIRFKSECLFRYKKNKEFIIENRRYLTNKIFNEKIISTFHHNELKPKYGLTTGIETLYMNIDFVMNELVDFINKTCKAYRIRRRVGSCLELENRDTSGTRFVCDKTTLRGFQGYIKGKNIIRASSPQLADDEYWTFSKAKSSKSVYHML